MDFDYSKLNGKIKEIYDNQSNFAKELGMSRASLNAKLNNRFDFTQKEILKSCELLNLPKNKIYEYFFKILD